VAATATYPVERRAILKIFPTRDNDMLKKIVCQLLLCVVCE
jgi:hypothetical protein